MARSTTRLPPVLRTTLEVVALTIVALVISVVTGVAFLVPLLVFGFALESTLVLVGGAAAGQVGFLLVAYGYVRRRGVDVVVRVPSRRDALTIAAGTVAALVAAVLLSMLLSLLDLIPESVIGELAETNPTFLLGLAVLSVVLIAPAEELLFRGALQGRLRETVGAAPAIVGASLLFGSMHFANYTGALAPIVATTFLLATVGAIFGLVYERTGNLAVPIAVHAAYNVVLLAASYLTL